MLQLKGEGRNVAQVQEPKHIEQIFADYFLAGFCFWGIKFSRNEGRSAKFAKIRSHENQLCHTVLKTPA